MVVVLCFSVSTSAPSSSQKKDALLELLENLLDKRDDVNMDNVNVDSPDDTDLLGELLDHRNVIRIEPTDDLKIDRRGGKAV